MQLLIKKNLKEVIFSVEFEMFNANLINKDTFSEHRLEKHYIWSQDLINALFSMNGIFASRETIIASINQKNKDDSYGENGFMPKYEDDKSKIKWRFRRNIQLYLAAYPNYKISTKYLSELKKVVTLCQKHDITLKLFISPSHATQWEVIRTTERWQAFEQWKREIVKISTVWDFSGYNTITNEKINNKMENYTDNSHYTKRVGDLILNRLNAYREETVPKDFGILVTPENIESHLAKIRADREIWAKENPNDVKLVQDMKIKDINLKNEEQEDIEVTSQFGLLNLENYSDVTKNLKIIDAVNIKK